MKTDPVYKATSTRATIPNEAVAIHCSDHRFQNAFREFLTEGLHLKSYALISIPGGGHFTSMTEIMPKFSKVGFQSLKFMIDRTGARRVILVGHEDCLFFKELLQFYFPEPHFHEKQFSSLRNAGRAMRERFEGQSVELYFADAGSDNSIQFLKIE